MNAAANDTAANDTAARASNATHSIAIAAIAGEFVVSCFPVVGGDVDTDREIFVRTFSGATAARRFYASQCALLACNAAKMDAEIDWVFRCVSSLASCLEREVPNEARALASAVVELEIATMARRNPAREARKAMALDRAHAALDRRMLNLSAKIQAEAATRAALGQP